MGTETYERPEGFVTYTIKGEECFIEDVFLHPDHRGRGDILTSGFNYIKVAAAAKGCKYISAGIWVNLPGAMRTLKVATRLGFKMVAAQNDQIIITCDLE